MEILHYPNSQAYVFPNADSDKLIIVLEGGGWESALGIKKKNKWIAVGLAKLLLMELSDSYTFLVPEKLKRQPGLDYEKDMDDRAHYTAENLIACYSESINSYLGDHEFSSVVIVGGSEGALIMPLVYEKLEKKDKVSAMVAYAFGGLSYYESLKIRSTRAGISSEDADIINDILATFSLEKTEFPDSFEEDYYGITHRYFNSFYHIRPFDYYQNINIPILFLHGIYDSTIAVESTFYVQDNLPEKPFEYIFFLWNHNPSTHAEHIHFQKKTAGWILKQP